MPEPFSRLTVHGMETLADIRAALAAAGERIERGALREDPRQFMDSLWSHVYDSAPLDLQPYVWSRLVDFSQLLGVMPTAGRIPERAPPDVHVHR